MSIPSRRSFPAPAIPAGITRAVAVIRPPRAAVQPAPAAAAEPGSAVTRKDFTDRLGLSADATDAEVLAAVDDKITEGVAERAWGASDALPATAEPSPRLTADQLYAAAWGDDA